MMEHSSHLEVVVNEARRRRVLVVEDHDGGRRSLSLLLEAMGYEVTPAKDGAAALRMLGASTVPDFVLTDLRLPDLDGLEVVEAARRLVPRPWIALITGWDPADLDSKLPGLDWIFQKPLAIAEIVAKLQEAEASDRLIPGILGNVDPEGFSSS